MIGCLQFSSLVLVFSCPRVRVSDHGYMKQKMEAAILTELNWKLKIPTVAHFLDLYLSKLDGGVLVSDRVFSSGSKVDSMQAKRRLAQQIILLHSLSIQGNGVKEMHFLCS